MNINIITCLLNIQLNSSIITTKLLSQILKEKRFSKKIVINGDNSRNIIFNVIDGSKDRLNSIHFWRPEIA